MQKLWVLNETEMTGSLVSSPEVLTVDANNGGSLSCTTTMNCMIDKHAQSLHTGTKVWYYLTHCLVFGANGSRMVKN